MAMKLVKNMEGKSLRQGMKNLEGKIEYKLELGAKFERDKEVLQEQIDMIWESDTALEDKRAALMLVRESVEALKKEYEEQVEAPIEEMKKEGQEILDEMEKKESILAEQEEKLRGVKLEAGSMDLKAAADETAAKKDFFARTKNEEQEKLDLQIQQLQMMNRHMMREKGKSH